MPRQPPLCRVGRERTTGLRERRQAGRCCRTVCRPPGDCLASGVLAGSVLYAADGPKTGNSWSRPGREEPAPASWGGANPQSQQTPRTTYRGRLRSPCRVSPGGCGAPHGASSGSDQRKHDRPPFGVSSKGEPMKRAPVTGVRRRRSMVGTRPACSSRHVRASRARGGMSDSGRVDAEHGHGAMTRFVGRTTGKETARPSRT